MDLRVHPRPVGARRLNRAASRSLALLAIVVAAAGGCGSSSPAPGLHVVDAWTRPLPPSADEAAIYLVVENRGDVADRLLGGSSSSCMAITLHRSTIDASGTSSMQDAAPDDAVIPAAGRLELAPNGLHLMCSGLAQDLVAGATWDVVLGFEHAASIAVHVDVVDR